MPDILPMLRGGHLDRAWTFTALHPTPCLFCRPVLRLDALPTVGLVQHDANVAPKQFSGPLITGRWTVRKTVVAWADWRSYYPVVPYWLDTTFLTPMLYSNSSRLLPESQH